jgi:hypothetical protein
MTKSGKSYLAKKQLLESELSGIFINIVDLEIMSGFEIVDKKTNIDLIKNLLKNKRKLQYNIKTENIDNELIILIDLLKKISKELNGVNICIDEVHLFKNNTLEKLSLLWKIGRHTNINAWGITQRPQDLDRAMTTQSEEIYIFQLSMEDNYLKSYGIALENIPTEKYKYYILKK